MTDFSTELDRIAQTARNTAKLNEAENALRELIMTLSPLELSDSQQQIRNVIARGFLPKRQRRLLATLERALVGTGAPTKRTSDSITTAAGVTERSSVIALREDIHGQLVQIADRGLFQWPLYEDLARRLFDKVAVRAIADGVPDKELCAVLREEVARHEALVTSRGFGYSVQAQHLTTERALEKTNAGLVRLIETVAAEFRQQLSRNRIPAKARLFRMLTSAWIAGAVDGRSRTTLDGIRGSKRLAENWKLWIGFAPFLTAGDFEVVVEALDHGHTRTLVCNVMRPMVSAFDELGAESCVVSECLFASRHERLEIVLVPPVRLAEQEVRLHCYMTASLVDLLEMESSAHHGMRLIIAPLTDQMAREVRKNQLLNAVVVDSGRSDAADLLRGLLALAVAEIAATVGVDRPITFNFARRFPLDRPDVGVEYRVRRRSVEQLLERYESDCGIRLWCSVRRSGKTTSCIDLQAHRGQAVVITETCEKTGAAHLDDSLYMAVREAIATRATLPADFVANAIRRSADYDVGRSKIVFILDEYESLFATLDLAARDKELRYAVVQPFLNQLVNFATSNLVIFLGLRPDAYYILPDQNQLSPHVRADSFPLFEYRPGEPDCEFRQLLQKVLTERVTFGEKFLGRLYAETGGHPVLTVNVLTTFFDWLIESERPLSRMYLSGDDIELFAEKHFTSQAVSRNPEYELLRQLARHGLSDTCRDETPWLYAVFQILRRVGREEGGSMTCSLSDADRLLQQLGLTQVLGVDAGSVARTGAMANFFEFRDQTIRPRIRLLARLAASAPTVTRM